MIEIFAQQSLLPFLAIHLMYIIICVAFWKRFTSKKGNKKKQPLFIFLFLLYLVFAFDGGDFYHYYQYIYYDDYHAMEPVYRVIGHMVFNQYILFRIIVWGGALLFTALTFKRFRLNVPRALFFLFVVFISEMDYARASLAMAIYFYGLSFILVPIRKKKVQSLLIGIALMLISILFHNSMIVAVLLTSLIVVPVNKYTIVPLLLLFVVSGALMNTMLDTVLGADMFGEDINAKIEGYASQEYDDHFSRLEWIRRYIEYATFFVPMIIATVKLFFKGAKPQNHKPIVNLYKITVGLLLLAVGTVLTDSLTFVLFYRFLYMSFIPITIMFCYFEQYGLIKRGTYRSILYLGAFCKLFGFAKRVAGGHLG